jgi:hypothetical protein
MLLAVDARVGRKNEYYGKAERPEKQISLLFLRLIVSSVTRRHRWGTAGSIQNEYPSTVMVWVVWRCFEVLVIALV